MLLNNFLTSLLWSVYLGAPASLFTQLTPFLFSLTSTLSSAMPCSAWTQRGSQPRKDPKAATSTPRHCWPTPLPWQVTRKGGQRYSCHWIRKPWRKVSAHLGTFSHPTFSESRIPHQKSPMTPSQDPFLSLLLTISLYLYFVYFLIFGHTTQHVVS